MLLVYPRFFTGQVLSATMKGLLPFSHAPHFFHPQKPPPPTGYFSKSTALQTGPHSHVLPVVIYLAINFGRRWWGKSDCSAGHFSSPEAPSASPAESAHRGLGVVIRTGPSGPAVRLPRQSAPGPLVRRVLSPRKRTRHVC